MKKITAAWLAAFFVMAGVAVAETYRVGPDEDIKKLSDVVDRLEPGDVVEITGDIIDTAVLSRSGTAEEPIIIRSAAGRRSKIDFAGKRIGINTLADHYVIENLELCNCSLLGIRHASDDITIRNCYFHDNYDGVLGSDNVNTGDIKIEYCEFYHNGGYGRSYGHQIYLASWKPGAGCIVQFNYFHDSAGGANIKTRMPRNVIRYNWIEGADNYECDLVDSDRGPDNLRPMHLLFLGNVVITNNVGNRHHQFNLASDQPRSPGTRNTYLIVNNLFVCNRAADEINLIRIGGDPEDVGFYNNIFVAPNLESYNLMILQDVHREVGPAGSPGHVKNLHGADNFISDNATQIPPELADCIRAAAAGFVDVGANDFSLAPGSPCIGKATDAAGVLPKYFPPMRRKMNPGEEKLRPIAEKADLGPIGATTADANDYPPWFGK